MSATSTYLKTQPIVARGEHISLESDISETRAKPNLNKTRASFELRYRARGIVTEVSILDDHYVAVTTQLRSTEKTHNVDLRFVDSKPIGFRNISWRWLYAALLFASLTAAEILADLYVRQAVVASYGISAAILFGTFAICCGIMCFYFTTESLHFVSLHGRASVVGISGSLGMRRKAKPCAAEIIKYVKIAHAYFKQSKAAYLRDEMREHTRLFEQGAFTEKQYQDAKMRILQAHD
ncbi:MAG TPA: hypothetical protein VET48_13945 [Steroidobacteraceae bacterium]|nr:hypothetical protein [Steroidobacteraceae bacterium]